MFTSDSSQKELFEAIFRMAFIAEYREGNNQAHLERIRGYTFTLARGLGLQQKDAQILSIASQLHDIGKAGLAEPLVLKEGQYTETDLDAAKVHTWLGCEMLKDAHSPFLQAGECIALSHHERWDGSGYPNGLRGEAIPLSARIVALADVFDALTTPRPYKMAVSPEEAQGLIQEGVASLFDPQLVQVFNDDFGEIQRIRRGRR
jgi:response regulator RpfG family c-di-GMP phosphodiesterase